MTPKEKAEQLVEIYSKQVAMTIKDQSLVCKVLNNDMSKQCSLIAVDEVLQQCLQFKIDYWLEVKQEIEKL